MYLIKIYIILSIFFFERFYNMSYLDENIYYKQLEDISKKVSKYVLSEKREIKTNKDIYNNSIRMNKIINDQKIKVLVMEKDTIIYRNNKYNKIRIFKNINNPLFFGTHNSCSTYNWKNIEKVTLKKDLILLDLYNDDNIANIHNLLYSLRNESNCFTISFLLILLQFAFGLVKKRNLLFMDFYDFYNPYTDQINEKELIKYFNFLEEPICPLNKIIFNELSRKDNFNRIIKRDYRLVDLRFPYKKETFLLAIFGKLFYKNFKISNTTATRCSIRSIDKIIMILLKHFLGDYIDGIIYIKQREYKENDFCNYIKRYDELKYHTKIFNDTCVDTEICIFEPSSALH